MLNNIDILKLLIKEWRSRKNKKSRHKKSNRGLYLAYWSRWLYSGWLCLKNKVEFFSYEIEEDVYFNILLYSKNPKVNITSYNGYFCLYNEKSVSNTSHKGLNEDLDILKLLNKINCLNTNDDIYINYYIRKSYIWYLLYSGKIQLRKCLLKKIRELKNG